MSTAPGVARFEWIAPAAHRWLPTTPFDTLLVVCVFVLVMHAREGRLPHLEQHRRLAPRKPHRLRPAHGVLSQGAAPRHGQLHRVRPRRPHEPLHHRPQLDHAGRAAPVRPGAARTAQDRSSALASPPGSAGSCCCSRSSSPLPPATRSIGSARRSSVRTRRPCRSSRSIYETLSETLGGIKLIKVFTMEPAERNKFHHRPRHTITAKCGSPSTTRS